MIGAPLNGTGFGLIWTPTFAVIGGVGVGAGVGAGAGAGAGDGAVGPELSVLHDTLTRTATHANAMDHVRTAVIDFFNIRLSLEC